MRGLIDLVLPRRCLLCGSIVPDPGGLCAQCWLRTHFIVPPYCAHCGYPLDHAGVVGATRALLCGPCAANPPRFQRGRAVFSYDRGSRELVLKFKHADRLEGAPLFGRWLAACGAELTADAALIIPVPLHWRRLVRRRYNQAAVLAMQLASLTGIRFLPQGLQRVRASEPSGALDWAGRRRSVAGAFRVREALAPVIVGACVLLIDDILTTGATAEACAACLIAAGAGRVDILTLGRAERARPVAAPRLGGRPLAKGSDAKDEELDYI